MASSVYNAYAQSAGEINNNLASFREDIDDIKGVNRQIVAKNKQLLQDAYTKTDLDALRGLGEEVGIRQFKKYGGKALDYVDKRFLGGKIGSDTEGFKNMLKNKLSNFKSQAEDGVDDLIGRGRNAFRQVNDGIDEINDRLAGNSATEGSSGSTETNETGGGGEDEGGETIEDDGSPTTDALDDVDRVDETDIGDMSFDDFMNQFSRDLPRTETGDIDFDRADEQLNMTLEDARGNMLRSQNANEASEETGQEGQKEDAGEEESKEDDAPEEETGGEESGNYGAEEPEEPSSALEGGEDATDALAGAGEDEAIDEGVGAGLEGAGTALDATGVGAVIGVPLQVAGAVLEGGALYEAGKGIVDWVEQLFGKKPDAPSVKTLALPKAPPSLAQRGMLLTPTMDTLDTQPSYSGGW
jgi:hypothetical protein